MSQNEILALLWLAFSAGLIAGFVLLIGRFEDRAERRRAHHAAE